MKVSLALINGTVYTMNEDNPRAEAIAIQGSKIISVGKTCDVKKLIGKDTTVINLRGKTVIPGIVDSHIHFLSYALRINEVDLDGAASIGEAVKRVKTKAVKTKPGEWITGGGWDKNLWDGGQFPDKRELDKVAPNNPVALTSKDVHALWVNSRALEKASITQDTPNPEAGEIVRDPMTGIVTGILLENAMKLVNSIVSKHTIEEMEQATKNAIKKAHSFGITSIHTPERREAFLVFQNLLANGELKLRVSMMLREDALESAIKVGLKTGFGNEKLKVGMLKLFADGSLGTQTAAMLEPYEGTTGEKGIITTPRKEMEKLIQRAATNGIWLAIHAIGDYANRMVLDLLEEAIESGVMKDIRYRIEHAQHLTEKDVKRFGKLGVIASVQPVHVALDMDIAEKHLGRRSRRAYQFRTLMETGTRLAFGSDCPVMSMNPFLGIFTAVTRMRTNSYPLGGWYPEERIKVEEAIKAYTIGGAYASGEENIKGSIDVGKLADVVVLSHNIFEVPEKEIPETKVYMTVFDGEIVYSKK